MEENNLFEPVDTGLQSAVALDDNAYGFDSNEGIETATAYLTMLPTLTLLLKWANLQI